MVKMEICSDLEDQQISKLSESSLIAYRIRKVRRDARLGLRKFKSSKPSSRGGDGTKFFLSASKEVSSVTNGSSEPPAQRLLRCSCRAELSPSGKFAQRKRKDHRTNTGKSGCSQRIGEMPISKQGRASDHCSERWRFT